MMMMMMMMMMMTTTTTTTMMGVEEDRRKRYEADEGWRGEGRSRTLLILVQRLSDRIRFPAERQEFTVVRHVQNMSGVNTASYKSGYLLRGSKEAGTCSWSFIHWLWNSLSAAINIRLQRALCRRGAHLKSRLVDEIFSADVRFVTFVIKMNQMHDGVTPIRPLLKYHFRCKM